MRWLKRTIRNWLTNEGPYPSVSKESSGIVGMSDDPRVHDDPVLNFRIFNAQNGRIIEFRKYDSSKDRTEVKTYIVVPEKDLGEYLSKCVSMELLR